MIQAILSTDRPEPRSGTPEYELAPNVLLVLLEDGTGRLLDMGGNFHAVSATGAEMLRETLRQGVGPAAENPYLQSVLDRPHGLVPHRIPADNLLDFDCFANPPPHDEPYAGLGRLGLDRATVEAALRCGADTMLTGIGADEMLVMSPFHLTDLLRRFRLLGAWREACKWARADNCSPWTILGPYGIANLLPGWLRGGLGTVLRGGYAGWERHSEWTIPPWVPRDFARRHRLRRLAIEEARRMYHSCRPAVLSVTLHMLRSRQGDVDRWPLGAPAGLTIAHPFLDTRVLRFGMGMKGRLPADPSGQKPLLGEAMRGVLPDKIIDRRRKTDFSPIHYLGLAKNLTPLETLVRETPLDYLGLVDKDILTRCLRQAALGVASGADGLQRLDLTLALIKWLSMQKEWRRGADASAATVYFLRAAGRPAAPALAAGGVR